MNDLLLKYLTNGGLIKTLGIVVLFLFTIGSGAIAGYDILSSQPVNPVVATYLSIVLTSIIQMLNLNQTAGIVSSALLIQPQPQQGTVQNGANS